MGRRRRRLSACVALETMIQISTVGALRIFAAPRALVTVASALFPGDNESSAVFSLARELTCDDLHTTENIALNVGHDAALTFARAHLVSRYIPTKNHQANNSGMPLDC